MNYIQIHKITEKDFDEIINLAGGVRFTTDSTADYNLGNAVIELKFVEEEGFEKKQRQEKIAVLFNEISNGAPVIPILPDRLNEDQRRRYERIIEGPIQTHVKKAASQLKSTAKQMEGNPLRILIILNTGYTALSPDEFESLSLKRVKADTSSIDYLICGGIYFYSDKFDSFIISPFKHFPINLSCSFTEAESLSASWASWLNDMATNLIKKGPPSQGKMPCLDIVFEVNGVSYVKPSPPFPRSNFWPSGERPRDNSSGLTHLPTVGVTYPDFSRDDWEILKGILPRESRLKESYAEWRKSVAEKDCQFDVLKPFVPVRFSVRNFSKEKILDFECLLKYSAELFDQNARRLVEDRREIDESKVMPSEYLLLEVLEIGQDKANDLCSLFRCVNLSKNEKQYVVFQDKRMFFEHGICVAAAYAQKENVDFIYYRKTKAF